MPSDIRFHCQNIHLDDGTLAAGEIACAPGEPMTLRLGAKSSYSWKLEDSAHIALGRFDPHVHFRESITPSKEGYEQETGSGKGYQELLKNIQKANTDYSLEAGCLSALRGGVSCVGAMGNTPWGPVGPERHAAMQLHYDENALIPIIVWPRMEPGAAPIPGHEGKDFGSTFGGSGLGKEDRAKMYKAWNGQAVSFHNDQPRSFETIEAFKKNAHPDDVLLHHLYYDGETVLACQLDTIEIAQQAKISSLLARHLPTGRALQQMHDAGKENSFAAPLEIGLDYMYWNRERLLEQEREIALVNCRRPAHPSEHDQLELIELARDLARSGADIFFGSDHAPHSKEAKAFRNGLPGSPGTRVIEHSLQYYMHLMKNHGYTWRDIDLLASVNPAKHMAKYVKFPYEVGAMETGAMANFTVFEPEASYKVNETRLARDLRDPEYHSCLKGEKQLRGKTLFTVANGHIYSAEKSIKRLN